MVKTIAKEAQTGAPRPRKTEHLPIVIVGAGFGGVGLAIKLREAGITDFTVLERIHAIGGTWARNTYPGAACDVPSTLYCYSFAPNPDWSRKYSTQPEILAYLTRTAEQHRIPQHVRFGVEVLDAHFDEASNRWQLTTNQGELTCDIFISATGPFAEAAYPAIPGLKDSPLPQIHTLHWDHDYSFRGKRVAVIGTGASAVQVIPQLQPQVKQLTVFQRTPPWIVPRLDRNIGKLEQQLYKRLPLTQKLSRSSWYAMIESFGLVGFVSTKFGRIFESLGRWQLKRQVPDPVLRQRLTPNYTIGCKRAIFSDAYYPALVQPNVTVVTSGIERIDGNCVVGSDGRRHEVDSIVLATGFKMLSNLSEQVRGTHGRSIAEDYHERPQSYLGITNAHFPNMFTILGPFAASGNQSALFMVENEITYIVDAITRIRRENIARFEVKPAVQDAFVDEMHARAQHGAWVDGGCKSYYTNDRGMNAGLYPDWSFFYRWRTARWDKHNYLVQKAAADTTEMHA
jgi:cation diffusion facilitator CzcD-associated flavoprotein CzcO